MATPQLPTPLFPARPWLMPVVGANGEPLDPIRDREEWVTSRLVGLGGSDVAAICGEHPQKSAIDVWLERTPGMGGVEFVDNESTIMGRYLEPFVLGLYAEGGDAWPRSGGAMFMLKPPSVYHRDRPWMRGSVDGIAYDPDVAGWPGDPANGWRSVEPDHGTEIKTHQWFAARAQYNRSDDGVPIEVPADKRIQCAWYMALYRLPRWTLAALVDTHHRHTYAIPHDQAVEDYLLEEAESFWRNHVLTGNPPPPDGSESFSRYLAQRFRTHDAELIKADNEIEVLAGDLMVTRATIKDLEEKKEILDQTIKTFIGEHAGVVTKNGVFTYKSQVGRVRTSEVINELVTRLGLTDEEAAELNDKYRGERIRVFLAPRNWKGPIK